MSGNVQIHDGQSWTQLDPGRELRAGDSIWTGRNGRILLMSEQGSVLLAPKSLVKIPAQALPNSFSVLFQTHGKVSADVDKRRKEHFSIQTPFLAAVVKGTEFDVEIDNDETRVAVDEGVVGVVDVETGEENDVVAGNSLAMATAASTSGSDFGGAGDTGERRDNGGDKWPGPQKVKQNNGGNGNAYAYGRNRNDDDDD